MRLWRMGWRLWRYRPWTAALGTLLWVGFHFTMFFTGLVLQAVFDHAGAGKAAGLNAYSLVALFVGIETGRFLAFFGAWYSWHRSWFIMASLLRANMLGALLALDGRPATTLPLSSGESVTRFRDDVEDVMWFIDIHLDVAGAVLFSAAALVVMGRINLLLTMVALAPLALLTVCNRALTLRLRGLRRAYRLATAATTSFLGDVFDAVLAVRTTGAEARISERLARLNRARTSAAVRDNTAREALISFNVASVDVAVGIVLLAAAPAMRRGTFSVGDLVLFTTYLEGLASLPRRVGRLQAFHRHAQVATDRMRPLAGPHTDDLSRPVPVHLKEEPPRIDPPPANSSFHFLLTEELSAIHPTTGRGVRAVGLRVDAGSITVVAGPVGSGKTTLVRALLGLVPIDGGQVLWDGHVVGDLAHFMRPPRLAYVPQVPRLFSESLLDNLSLGLECEQTGLADALHVATLDPDVAGMPDGLHTLLGPRGVRLSGGQVQRAACARAVLTGASVIVVDDPSSALDAETEGTMWERLLGRKKCGLLVVSNRPEIVAQAAQVVLLEEGEVSATGPGHEMASYVSRVGDPTG